jgi:hypothetical protein
MTFNFINHRTPLLVLLISLAGCASPYTIPDRIIEPLESPALKTFDGNEEFKAYALSVATAREYVDDTEDKLNAKKHGSGALEEITVTARKTAESTVAMATEEFANEEITNNQESGVDEGDIIKVIGEYLVVLRKGRLYTVRIGRESKSPLIPIDSIDVSKPGWPHEAWYDELLVHKNLIVVTGYAYCGSKKENCPFGRSVAELNFLQMDADGQLEHLSTWGIAAGDYYDGENYASRLVNGRLRVYMPVEMFSYYQDEVDELFNSPKVATLPQDNSQAIEWMPLLEPQDVYRPMQATLEPVMHTFLDCQLVTADITCKGMAITGPWRALNYTSRDATYLWLESENPDEEWIYYSDRDDYNDEIDSIYFGTSLIYRIAGDEPTVSVISVEGTPVNQFSFAERGENLFALFMTQIDIDDRANTRTRYPQLQKIPLVGFDNAVAELPPPTLLSPINGYPVVRFTENHVALGNSYEGWSPIKGSEFNLLLQPLMGDVATTLWLGHSANRIEPVGDHLYVMGNDEGVFLEASTVSLGSAPAVSSRLKLHEFSEAEDMSHAFNYRQFSPSTGLVGFTSHWRTNVYKTKPDGSISYSWDYEDETANVNFLLVDEYFQLYTAGLLDGKTLDLGISEEDCESSCYDWYGNTRPFFIGQRIFGLAGFTLIEAQLSGGMVGELQRIDIRK